MYSNEIYPVGYPADGFFNEDVGRDYFGMPPEYHHPQPMPCPEYPPMPPVQPPMPPMPPPMPPMDLMPGMKMQCMMHLKHLLEKMKDKKASLIIEGAKGNFDCIKIMSVNDCMVVVETRNGVCLIPLDEITAICMTKEVAEDVLKDKK